MTHLLPDVPILVVVAHFLALVLLFGQTFVSYIRRLALKRQLQETLKPAQPFGRKGFLHEERQLNSSRQKPAERHLA